jgi:GAF domain-containing protein
MHMKGADHPVVVWNAAMQEEREWPETVLKQFQLVAQIFANALQRKQTEKSLSGTNHGVLL